MLQYKSKSIGYKCLKNQITQFEDYSISPIQKEHIEKIRIWRNHQMDVLRQVSKISKTEQSIYFSENVWSQYEKHEPSIILLGFFLRGDLIGYGGLVSIEWHHRRAEVSFLSATERASNQSIYTNDFLAFLTLIKALAFEQINLNRLFSETYCFREYHIGLLELSGFVKEGVLREHTILDGNPVDSIIHGCLLK
jgi:RimJ/RimL family protein N-acetyltransferase